MIQPKESKSKSHFYISIVKSAIRFWACYELYNGKLQLAALFFIMAELLGIAEEIF